MGAEAKATDVAPLRPVAGRVPPHSLDAEGAVLSGCLLDTKLADSVMALGLTPTHFYADRNRRIFEAIVYLRSNDSPIDTVSVAERLRDEDRLEQVGGVKYLAMLCDAIPSLGHIEHYVLTVRDKARQRLMIAALQTFAAEGYAPEEQWFERIEQTVADITHQYTQRGFVTLKEATKAAFEEVTAAAQRGDDVTGLATGFTHLDKKTTGLRDGDLVVVAGRPGMGKTAFILNVALNVAAPTKRESTGDAFERVEVVEPGVGVAFFSLEMLSEELAMRAISYTGRVNSQRLRSGHLQADDWTPFTAATAELGNYPVWIDDTSSLSVLEIRARCRKLQSDIARGVTDVACSRLGLVVVDYLQLVGGVRGRGQSREEFVAEMTRALKALAKELRVPVVALSQLNRGCETRPDKRPLISDLRESGAIEQDSDVVIFIYRDDYYEKESQDRGIAEIILAKQRKGPTGTVKLKWTKDYTRFDNLADDYDFDEWDDDTA